MAAVIHINKHNAAGNSEKVVHSCFKGFGTCYTHLVSTRSVFVGRKRVGIYSGSDPCRLYVSRSLRNLLTILFATLGCRVFSTRHSDVKRPYTLLFTESSGEEEPVSAAGTKDDPDQSSDDDDVIFVCEATPTDDQRSRALQLQLPPTFFMYEDHVSERGKSPLV